MTDELTPEKLDQIEARANAATKGAATAVYAIGWVLTRLAFMGYQLTLAAYDIFVNGFRGELRLGGDEKPRVTEP